jgi:putative copper export protein/methionine-rich copper-binding protein CopC
MTATAREQSGTLEGLMRQFVRLLLLTAVLGGGLAMQQPSAYAHAKLEGSTPAPGAQLSAAPTEIRLDFTEEVDPARLRVTFDNGAQLIDLGAPFLDPVSPDVAVIPIVGPVPNGNVGFSWRSVGDDGHVIDGRVDFVVSAPVPATTPPTTPLTAPPAASLAPSIGPITDALTPPVAVTVPTSLLAPLVTVPAVAPVESVNAAAEEIETTDGVGDALDLADSGSSSAASFLLGVTRWIGYIGLSIWTGAFLSVAWLWTTAPRSQQFRLWMRGAWVALLVSSILAVIFQSWLIKGSPGLLIGDLWDITAGRGILGKLIIVVGLATFVQSPEMMSSTAGRVGAGAVTLVLALATAASGHAGTSRWLMLGMLAQTVHVLAVATWLGLLMILGLVMLREANDNDARFAVAQFSSIATALLGVIVATGVFQTLRFVGGPGNLFSSGHGRWLLLKLVVVAAMLFVAKVNRGRIGNGMIGRGAISARTREQLRRAMVTEFVLGIVVFAVTAILVVQAPAA